MANEFSDSQVTTEYVELRLEQFAAEMRVALDSLGGGRWQCDAVIDHAFREMVFTIRGMMATTSLKIIDICYPRDWWQAVRERWMPEWWLQKYPVAVRRHYVQVMDLHPDVPIPPSVGRSIRYAVHRKS